ncbi:MAG: hypothetical protein ACRDDX_12865 [Cellulosilyticaceae bacterium]
MNGVLKEEDFVWRELRPNNMQSNPLEGYYVLIKASEKHYRKYTILMHKEADEAGLVLEKGKVYYVLLERHYHDVEEELIIPDPMTDETRRNIWEKGNVDCMVNDYGSFTAVYNDLESAKKRAYIGYAHIFGYLIPTYCKKE